MLKRRLIVRLLDAPEETRQVIIHADVKILFVYKIIFWMAPLYLLVLPIFAFIFLKEIFLYLTGAMAALYVVFLEDFLYRKSILKAIRN